jgi:hypothetical protein
MHYIEIAHALPGRLRLRLPFLRDRPSEATPLSDQVVELDGVIEVQCRPFTGSLLCSYDPARTSEGEIIAAVQRLTGVERVFRTGPSMDAREEDALLLSLAAQDGTEIADAAAGLFQRLNLDVLRFTEGRLDIGTLAALAFAVAGAVEVGVTKKLPAPPWFNLAWWSFRTFATMEQAAIERARKSARGGQTQTSPPGRTMLTGDASG